MSRRKRVEGDRTKLISALAGIAFLVAAPTAQALTIQPKTPPGENPLNRAYELVTPPDKNNRGVNAVRDRSNVFREENLGDITALSSLSGDAFLLGAQLSVLDPTHISAGWIRDIVEIRRGEHGWETRSVNDLKPRHPTPLNQSFTQPTAVDAEFGALAMWHKASLFPSDSTFGVRLRRASGGYLGSGFYDWFPQGYPTVTHDEGLSADAAVFTDDGKALLRWQVHTGLAGPGDPSLDLQSGKAIYMQIPPGTGPHELVQECTGVLGDDATLIPARSGSGGPNDTIGTLECGTDEVTHRDGAVAGGTGSDEGGPRPISDDARRVFFTSPDPAGAPTSCSADTGAQTSCPPQLFIRQYDAAGQNPRVRWLSRPQVPGQQIGLLGPAVLQGASVDGRVVYLSTPTPLSADDPNGGPSAPVAEGTYDPDSWDLYQLELTSSLAAEPAVSQITRISGGQGGVDDPGVEHGVSGNPGNALRFLSKGGQRAYFSTESPLTGADNSRPGGGVTDPAGSPGDNVGRNLYLFDSDRSGAQRWKFIARLPREHSGLPECASAGALSQAGLFEAVTMPRPSARNHVNCVRGSSSGDGIAFMTNGRLTADDDDDAFDIYVYEASQDRLRRISALPEDESSYGCHFHVTESVLATCNADIGFTSYTWASRGTSGFQQYNLAEDAQGRLQAVYFESRVGLVELDTNKGHMDVYEWRRAENQLELISPGNQHRDAWYKGNDTEGRTIFFYTAAGLDPRELEPGDFDLFAARVDGGFPFKVPDPPRCDVLAGSCQGGMQAAPVAPSAVSSTLMGAGNMVEPKRRTRKACVKGKVKRNGRCVAVKRKQAKRVKRGRAGR